MQANSKSYPFSCYSRASNSPATFQHTGYNGYESCTGWPLIRGDHKHPNGHSYSYWKSRGQGVFHHVASNGWWEQDIGAFTAFNVGSSPTAYNNALSDVVNKARGGLDLTVDVAQARQNMRMFNAYQTFMQYASNFKRGKVRGLAKTAGAIWLEYVYGWKPLLQDIYLAADESLRYTLNQYSTVKGVGYFRDTVPTALTDGWTAIGNKVPIRYEDSVTISLVLDNSKTFDAARWGSLNPMSIGWELLPYSFVIDWFYDVGEFLRNFETAMLYGRSVVDGYSSVLRVAKVDSFGGSQISSGSGWKEFTTGSWWARRVSFMRSRLTTFPVPSRVTTKTSLSPWRSANAIGLLTQFL